MINKVGAFTSFGGDLKSVIVGNMVSADYFDLIPNKKTKQIIQKIVIQTRPRSNLTIGEP